MAHIILYIYTVYTQALACYSERIIGRICVYGKAAVEDGRCVDIKMSSLSYSIN